MTDSIVDRLRLALEDDLGSERLRAALDAGTYPDPSFVPVLIERCALEPDFSVRETLTWALMRHPADLTLPLLLDAVASGGPQAQSQALHTLSKIGDARGWSAITPELLHSADDEIARSAWRAAVLLVPDAERAALATELVAELGPGERLRRSSLSRAIVALGDAGIAALALALEHPDELLREHALATELLASDPDTGFEEAIYEAKKIVALGTSAK